MPPGIVALRHGRAIFPYKVICSYSQHIPCKSDIRCQEVVRGLDLLQVSADSTWAAKPCELLSVSFSLPSSDCCSPTLLTGLFWDMSETRLSDCASPKPLPSAPCSCSWEPSSAASREKPYVRPGTLPSKVWALRHTSSQAVKQKQKR